MPARSYPAPPDSEDHLRDFSIQVPEFYNFGYDVVDAWAEKEPDKPALLWVNQQGEERHYSFQDLTTGSDRAARLLRDCGISRGDRVFLMLPRIPEWWVLVVALIKMGAVYTPAPTLLTPHDISYRIRIGRFALVITDQENSPKVNEAIREMPVHPACMVVYGDLPGWISYPKRIRSLPSPPEGNYPLVKTRSSDPLLIFLPRGRRVSPRWSSMTTATRSATSSPHGCGRT
jgi:acetyl-CoA synthetase